MRTTAMHALARFDRLRITATLAGSIALAAPLVGCAGGPSLNELNAVTPMRDPTVDDTAPGAPFRPGQRRDVGDAQATFDLPGWSQHVEGTFMAGDLDGDGLDDLVIWGRLQNDADIVPCHMGCPGFEQGEVHVFYGSPTLGADGALRPDATIRTWHVNGLALSVDAAGDVDGDGRADLVVGVGRRGECAQGNVLVVRGGARLSGVRDVRDVGALIREEASCTRFDEVAGLGDVDGDGLGDFAIGAPQDGVDDGDETSGRLFLFYGDASEPPARRSEADASASFVEEGFARFGYAQRAGDVDGDGVADFLVRHEADAAGDQAWWLVLGRPERFAGGNEIAAVATRIVATTLHGIGDVDGDGRDDLAATMWSGARDGLVLWGRDEWPESVDPSAADTWIERGEDGRTSSIAPRQVLPAGDLDGDGRADLFYADPHYGTDAARGAVYLFRGAVARASGGLTLPEATAFLGQDWVSVLEPDARRGYDSLGRSIAAGSDLNGDGIDDVVLAATQAPDGGRAYLWLGREVE